MPYFIAILFSVSFFNASLVQANLYETHSALFNAFLPIEHIEMNSTAKSLIDEANVEIWQKINENDQLKLLVRLFSNLSVLTLPVIGKGFEHFVAHNEHEVELASYKSIKPVRDYLASIGKDGLTIGFADLNRDERLLLIEMLIQNESNYWRRLAFSIKIYYTSQMYSGQFGKYLSGIQHRPSFANYTPYLPAFNTHLRYDARNKTIEGEIDYLFVGSGASASSAAFSLQQAGKKVLIVEKGSFVIPGAIDTKSNFSFLDSNGLRTSASGSVYFVNAGKIVGGGPMVNLDIWLSPTKKFARTQFDKWRELGLIPEYLWNYEQVKAARKWVEDIIEPRQVKMSELDTNNLKIAEGAEALGFSYHLHKLSSYKDRENPYEVTNKKSSLERFIIPAMLNSSNTTYPLSILPNCEVNKVRIKNGVALGVKCKINTPLTNAGILNDLYNWHIPEGTTVKINAKKVVLAAGNLGSTLILLNTKEIDNKNIGRGFVAHPMMPVIAEFNETMDRCNPLESGVYIDEFITTDNNNPKLDLLIETAAGNPSLAAIMVPGNPQEIAQGVENIKYRGGAGVVLFDSVNPNNRISLNTFGGPQIYYDLSDDDKKRAIEGVCKLMEVLFAAGAKKVSFFSHEDVLKDNDLTKFSYITDPSQIEMVRENLKLTPNQNFMMSGHMLGANKIGMSEETSVVDPHYKVWNIENLFVADVSILPASPHINPMPLAYTIGKMFADDQLREENSADLPNEEQHILLDL